MLGLLPVALDALLDRAAAGLRFGGKIEEKVILDAGEDEGDEEEGQGDGGEPDAAGLERDGLAGA